MSIVWSFLVTFWTNLPWIAIALMAVFAWLRQKDSRVLLLQALGSSAFFALIIARWVVLWLLSMTSAGSAISYATTIIFSFLLFVALVLFATGYCLEKLRRKNTPGLPVSATPIN